MIIGIASDHRGYLLKKKLVKFLQKKYQVIDFGTDSLDSVDYPDFSLKIGNAIREGKINFGIVICGSGIGISIAANKIKGIYAAKVDSVKDAYYSRFDNDANVVSLSGKMTYFMAKKIILKFLNTPFSNIERHKKRILKIKDIEKNER